MSLTTVLKTIRSCKIIVDSMFHGVLRTLSLLVVRPHYPLPTKDLLSRTDLNAETTTASDSLRLSPLFRCVPATSGSSFFPRTLC